MRVYLLAGRQPSKQAGGLLDSDYAGAFAVKSMWYAGAKSMYFLQKTNVDKIINCLNVCSFIGIQQHQGYITVAEIEDRVKKDTDGGPCLAPPNNSDIGRVGCPQLRGGGGGQRS